MAEGGRNQESLFGLSCSCFLLENENNVFETRRNQPRCRQPIPPHLAPCEQPRGWACLVSYRTQGLPRLAFPQALTSPFTTSISQTWLWFAFCLCLIPEGKCSGLSRNQIILYVGCVRWILVFDNKNKNKI